MKKNAFKDISRKSLGFAIVILIFSVLNYFYIRGEHRPDNDVFPIIVFSFYFAFMIITPLGLLMAETSSEKSLLFYATIIVMLSCSLPLVSGI